jgi:hypothetical protein
VSVSYEFEGTPTGGRAEARRKRRQRRRRLLVVAGAVAVAVLLGFTAYLVQSGDEKAATPQAQVRSQSTLLFQVQALSGSAVSNALLAHDPNSGDDRDAGSGSVVLLPPQLLVPVAGSGQLRLDVAVKTVPPESTRNAVADLLGVTVDGSWVLDLPTTAKLVDAVGGVSVDVDVPVLGGPGGRVVLLNPGGQKLDGARAGAFMTYLGEGEEEAARLARLQEVFAGVLRALPQSTAEVVTLLNGLGKRSVPSVPVPKLAEVLVGLASDGRDDALAYDSLPVVAIDTGGGTLTYRIDAEPARALVDRLLAQSVPPGVRSGGNRVLVLNGVGTPNIGEKVRAKVVPAGFVFVGSRNAQSFDYARTLVLVPGETVEAQQLGERVAKALGVPATAVATAPIGTVADVIVVVGADFRP